MSKNQELKSPTRRAFIRKAGVGIGIGAAGAVALALSDETGEAAEKPDRSFKAATYRETEHVRMSYESARF